MQKGKSNYERVILILSALVAVGLSAWLIFMSLGFSSSVETSTPKKGAELGTAPIKSVEDAITRAITDPKPWVAVVRANKPVPLNKSVLLVLKDEQPYDLFLDDPQLRPPMSNSFLRNNELEFLSPNVGDLDPDNDGFSNLEEFSAKPASTNPRMPSPIRPSLTNCSWCSGSPMTTGSRFVPPRLLTRWRPRTTSARTGLLTRTPWMRAVSLT